MIVVAGGSGVLGRLVVRTLTADGRHVVVLVRDARRAAEVLGSDVEVRVADVRHPSGLAAAVDGASTVVSAVHGFLGGRGAGPADVDERGNGHLTAAARAAGADIVLVSVLGAAPESPMELARAKYAAERAVRRSGAGWTIVRAGPFLDTWIPLLRGTAGRSGRPLVFGRGEQPIAFASAADVAAVVGRAATDPALRNRILEVFGTPLTMTELAMAVQVADGRQAVPRHLPRGLLRTLATLAPVAPGFARASTAALVMDTIDLGQGDPDLIATLGLPAATGVVELLGSLG